MTLIRSALLALYMAVLTVPYAFIAMACAPLPPMARYKVISGWARIVMVGVRFITGIRHTVLGAERMPAQPAVALVKHQSAWETIALQCILPPQCYVLKKELLKLPFFGWGLAQMPNVAIDRAAGRDALDQVVNQGKDRLSEGFWVIVFPEGTRVPVGTHKRYKVGGAQLAAATGVPVVPIAHNAGEFWPRNAFVKRPGTITVSIGPTIASEGRTAAQITREAEAWIEGEMQRLFPHHYVGGKGESGSSPA